VDDHAIVQEGIRKALQGEEDFEIVGTATDGRKALDLVKSLKPHIVILDIAMPHMDGVETTHAIKKWDDKIRIVIFSMYSDSEYVTSLFRRGISGYVLKGEPVPELVLALKAVRGGGSFFSGPAREKLEDHIKQLESGRGIPVVDREDGIAKLSTREKEVFVLLADGLKPKQIGDRLCISHKTVETHKYNILEKLGVNSVTDLTKIAIGKHLIAS